MIARPPVGAGILAATAVGATAGWLTARHIMGAKLAAARHAAHHDPLTGIHNRAGLYTAGDRIIATGHNAGRPVAVTVVDLVGFKQVNDRYGHKAGDAILTIVAARLNQAVGPCGIAARLGGDEFAAIATGPHILNEWTWLNDWLHGLHTRLTGEVCVDGRVVAVGATLGASLADPSRPFQAWAHAADLAMYQARKKHTSIEITVGTPPQVQDRPPVRIRELQRPTQPAHAGS